MKLTMMMILVLSGTFALVQVQGHRRWGHIGHTMDLPSQLFTSHPESYEPIIPSPLEDIWGWTGDNIFGSPLFPGGMMQDQMSPYGPFWERGPSFGGQIGQWPVSGQFGQNGQLWLPNDQNGWNKPLSDNNINGLSGQWSEQSQNIWPMTDDQYNNGRISNANTGNSDPWATYTKFTGGNQMFGNQLLGNQQFGPNSGVTSGLTQNGFGSIDGSLSQNGIQSGNSQFNSGFPVLAGTSGLNGVQAANIPSGMADDSNNNNNIPFQWLRKK